MPAPFVSTDPDVRFRFELIDPLDKLHYRDLLDWASKDLLVYLDDPFGTMVGFVHSEWSSMLAHQLNDGVLDPEGSEPSPWLFHSADWPGRDSAGKVSNIGVLLRWIADDVLVALCDYAPDEKPGDGQGPAGNIIGYLHADRAVEVVRILNATDDLHGVFSRISQLTSCIRPTSEWGGDEIDVRVADFWFWTLGDQWVAVVGDHERATWWEGVDEGEIAASGRPEVHEYRIWQLPPSGTLRFCDDEGAEHSVVIPVTLPDAVRFHGDVARFMAWCDRNTVDIRSAFDVADEVVAELTFDEAEALGFDGTLRTGRYEPVVTDLAFEVHGSDAAAAITGTIDGETGFDIVSVNPAIIDPHFVHGPFVDGDPLQPHMGTIVVQPIYDVIAAAFEGTPPGDYDHAANFADIVRARDNLGRAAAAMGPDSLEGVDVVVTSDETSGSNASAVRDAHGRVRVWTGQQYGWARLADIEWDGA